MAKDLSQETVTLDDGKTYKNVTMGVGEAILRLVHVELSYSNDFSKPPDDLVKERALIVEALNQHKLDLGLDCDGDGVPDDVSLFKETAETSCCRIVSDTSRSTSNSASSRRRRSSRSRK